MTEDLTRGNGKASREGWCPLAAVLWPCDMSPKSLGAGPSGTQNVPLLRNDNLLLDSFNIPTPEPSLLLRPTQLRGALAQPTRAAYLGSHCIVSEVHTAMPHLN